MKIKQGFELRRIVNENVIMAKGMGQVRFDKLIVLNESAACLWQAVVDKNFTVETLRDILLENYEVEAEVAAADAAAVLETWKSAGLVAE